VGHLVALDFYFWDKDGHLYAPRTILVIRRQKEIYIREGDPFYNKYYNRNKQIIQEVKEKQTEKEKIKEKKGKWLVELRSFFLSQRDILGCIKALNIIRRRPLIKKQFSSSS